MLLSSLLEASTSLEQSSEEGAEGGEDVRPNIERIDSNDTLQGASNVAGASSGPIEAADEVRSPPSNVGKFSNQTRNDGAGIQLDIIQQPQRARICGLSVADRRSIHPPPVIKIEGLGTAEACKHILFASLWSKDLQQNLSHAIKSIEGPSLLYTAVTADSGLDNTARIPDPALTYAVSPSEAYQNSQMLTGQLVAICSPLVDTDKNRGLFFVFHDLAVRSSGFYKLKFDLYLMSDIAKTAPIATVVSEVFQVFSPKTYPGITKTTALSKCFARQGVKLRLRPSQAEKKKTGEKTIEDDEIDEDEEDYD
ncbi:hypothetical protein BCR33DRAFT_761113 [Rhizoclosmatium globosum]|uniref:Velvet domain-containing protein n=1 Tax=Rhizoclosmatium globosum TaxID=329046 RepID=A0A1Y2D3C7_9FUNG|nr:hypothetical protein BCR33DRAFT_761113 [Rhizoclosmatium globosum]|eukprot:ORY53793.1 hypothetical protein BCR33DRAFT_761113 [Rhizoclosmatium globosum]